MPRLGTIAPSFLVERIHFFPLSSRSIDEILSTDEFVDPRLSSKFIEEHKGLNPKKCLES